MSPPESAAPIIPTITVPTTREKSKKAIMFIIITYLIHKFSNIIFDTNWVNFN